MVETSTEPSPSVTSPDMEYQLGSEGLDWFGPAGTGPGARRRPRRQMPGGLCHAVPRNGTVPACGSDVTLRLWADRPWEQGEFTRCARCTELVPVSS
jgi:hypothetical protein